MVKGEQLPADSQEQGTRPDTIDLAAQLVGGWEAEVGGPELGADLCYTGRTCFCFKNVCVSRAWWRMPLVPAFGRQKQADF